MPVPDTGTSAPQVEADTGQTESLDDWAVKGDAAPQKPRDTATGRYRPGKPRANTSQDAAEALRATVEQGGGGVPPVEEEIAPEGEEERQKPNSRKVRIVVNGREEEVDASSEEFRKLNAISSMRASQEAFREAAKLRKEAQQIRDALASAKAEITKNPFKLLKTLGMDDAQIQEAARRAVYEKVAETIDPNTGEPYTPEQQRIIQLQKELNSKTEQEQAQKARQESIQKERMMEVMRKDIDRTFTEALKETGLPPTPYTMMRLADAIESLGPDADPKMIAPIVFEDLTRELADTIATMPMEVVVKVLPREFLNSLRKYDVEQARRGKEKLSGTPRSIPDNASRRIPDRKAKTTTVDEAQEWLDKWAEGG